MCETNLFLDRIPSFPNWERKYVPDVNGKYVYLVGCKSTHPTWVISVGKLWWWEMWQIFPSCDNISRPKKTYYMWEQILIYTVFSSLLYIINSKEDTIKKYEQQFNNFEMEIFVPRIDSEGGLVLCARNLTHYKFLILLLGGFITTQKITGLEMKSNSALPPIAGIYLVSRTAGKRKIADNSRTINTAHIFSYTVHSNTQPTCSLFSYTVDSYIHPKCSGTQLTATYIPHHMFIVQLHSWQLHTAHMFSYTVDN